jgi:hypothetical protein
MKIIVLSACFLLFFLNPSVYAAEKFVVLNYQELQRSKTTILTPEEQGLLRQFEQSNLPDLATAGKIDYIIIPSESTQAADMSFRDWAIVETPCSSSTEARHLKRIAITEDLRRSFWKLLAQSKIQAVNDIVVLDSEDARDLVRLAWLNRGSSSHYYGVPTAKDFNDQFLRNISRGWFLDSPPGNRLFIITGLTTSVNANVYLCLQDSDNDNVPTPFFEVYSGDRVTLSSIISILESDSVPAAFVLKLKFFGIHPNPTEIEEIKGNLSIVFKSHDGREIPTTATLDRKRENDEIKLTVTAPKEILSSEELQISIHQGTLQLFDAKRKTLGSSISIPLPEPHEVLREGCPCFDLAIAEVGYAKGFAAHNILYYTVDAEGFQYPVDLKSLLEEYKNNHSGASSFFDSPSFFSLQRVPRLRNREQLLNSMSSTREIREALWRQIMIGLSVAPGANILLVKNSGGPTTNARDRDLINNGTTFLQLFLEEKLRSIGRETVSVLVTERRAGKVNPFGSIDVFMVPTESIAPETAATSPLTTDNAAITHP